MNRIKRICLSMLMIVLVIAAVFQLGIGGAFAEDAVQAGEYITSLFDNKRAGTKTVIGSDEYIYFDLAAGKVNITSTTYTGYVYIKGSTTPELVTGPHTANNKYYVYQSSSKNRDTTGYEKKEDCTNHRNCSIPNYPRVTHNGEPWRDYITNNTRVTEVSENWDTAAGDLGRTDTKNTITFDAGGTYDVVIDNLWSTYYHANEGRTTGGITAHLGTRTDTDIQLKMKGDNRFCNIHYHSYEKKNNQIVFSNGDSESAPGSITVADFKLNFSANHWCSAIGGNDTSYDRSDGIVIDSGVVYAGTTAADNCTALGGGGNEYGGVTINNGKVTAVAATTGTAIGGGIGWGDKGGNADVTINNGEVYAYNFGVDNSSSDKFEHYVPAVAIGGGSSQRSRGNDRTTVNITGGTVYAQCMGGVAIGGGGSALQTGGNATINITGGTIIAKSTSGKFKGTADPDVVDISAGASIGGGTGKTGGGSVEMNISGGIIRAGSIGGGKTTGSGNIGSANITITDGDIGGQFIMAEGASKNCTFTMSGGKVHSTDLINGNTITDIEDPCSDVPISYLEENGGAVWMDDKNGVTDISGGSIYDCSAKLGGAVYMTGGTLTLSGTGEIRNNAAHTDGGGGVYVSGGNVHVSGGAISNNAADLDGGGIYVGGGNVDVSGGTISNNTAKLDGGGMFVGNGDVDVSGGTISNNTATSNGGGIYVAGNYSMTAGEVISNKATNGGGIYVNDGIVTMYGGKIDSNTSTEYGGGMYVSTTSSDALVDIFSGSVSNNKSKSGGGVAVFSTSDKNINITVGVNCVHPDLGDHSFDRAFTPFEYPNADECGGAHSGHTNHIENLTHSSCPHVENNIATENGGGFFLTSPKTHLVFYCVYEEGNIAHGKQQCYNMDVRGGHVKVGDDTFDYTKTDPVKGNIVMKSSILVEGGTVDVYGKMHNPNFTDDITVDVKQKDHYYVDHRRTDLNTEVKHYKVHYYENFKGEGDTPTGLYIARQYPDDPHHDDQNREKYNFTIMSSIFVHPGYKIVGWNTKPDDTGIPYETNATYNLLDLIDNNQMGAYNSKGEYDPHLFLIYAIWERCGYVLKFDPNVGEGDTYTGTMENQRVTVGLLDGSQKINKNLFKRPGYKFTGWTLIPKPTADDRVYADCEQIKEDFTMEDGGSVTLYANWEICDHVDYLTYTADGGTLTETCSNCGKHSATATVSAVSCYYDANEHPATAEYSANWLGNKPGILYDMAPSEWDSKDEIDESWSAASVPLHAGEYTAKLTVQDGITAQTEYTISPIRWATPEVPKVDFKVENGKSIIQIISPTDNNIEYWIQSLDMDNNKNSLDAYPDWVKDPKFTDIPFGNYYYFYAKRIADRDHMESIPSQSEAYLATGGNIVYIENDTGIKVVPKYGGGKFEYSVSADEGYHLRNYHDNSNEAAEQAIPIPGSGDQAYNRGSITVTNSPTPADGTYTYTVVFDQVAYHQVTLKFWGAVKNASVTHKVTDGQIFRDFNGKDTNISCDSAFTAQFTLNDYIPDEYSAQKLHFTEEIPAGTTVIMKVKGGYWYYNLDADKSIIDLSEFISMGGEANYSLNTADNTSATTITYQFIVDFSKAAQYITDGSTLGASLELTPNPTPAAPIVPTPENTSISLGIKEKAKFALSLEDAAGKSASFKGTYTPSAGAASIWNGRRTALVLTAASPSTVPADLRLTAVVDGSTTLYKMTSKRQFIIPLGDISNKDIKITLSSKTFNSSEKNLEFTANWYVSQSSAENSPLNGYNADSCNVSFSCKKDSVPSVRIDGTQHLCKKGGKLEVTVNYKGVPSHENIVAYMYRKSGDEYVYTGANVSIENETINYEQHSKRTSFNMGDMGNGSYKIVVVVQESGANILQVPYYFVIA